MEVGLILISVDGFQQHGEVLSESGFGWKSEIRLMTILITSVLFTEINTPSHILVHNDVTYFIYMLYQYYRVLNIFWGTMVKFFL